MAALLVLSLSIGAQKGGMQTGNAQNVAPKDSETQDDGTQDRKTSNGQMQVGWLYSDRQGSAAPKGDTLHVGPSDLNIKDLQTGDYSYVIIRQKSKDGPAAGMILVKMNVERKTYHDKPAIVVRQQWDRDSIVHKAYTVFDARDFSTLYHDTYWKFYGYATIFDFETRQFTSRTEDRPIPDSIKTRCEKEFAGSFGKYNLNWHDDLIIYSMLPYKENRTFVINYYDPGTGQLPEEVPYTVTKSDLLVNRGGEKVDCWVLEHTDENGTERFWIAKKTREVLKEEDEFKGGYRYKLRIGISGT